MKRVGLYLSLFFVFTLILSISSCKDDELELPPPQIEGASAYIWSPKCESYPLTIKSEGDWIIYSDAEWAYIPAAQRKGTGNDVIWIYLEENSSIDSRSGELTVQSGADPSLCSKISITQQGQSSSDDNSLLTSNLSKNYAVGWGYNIFGEYSSVKEVRNQVINYQKIKDLEELGDINVSDQPQYSVQYLKTIANSAEDFSHSTSRNVTTKLNLLVYKKEVTKRFTTDVFVHTDVNLSTLSILNVVARRHVSEGVLRSLSLRERDMILTQEFKNDVRSLEQGIMNAREFIRRNGTHVVISAYLGGRLDYSLSIKKTKTTQVETCLTTTYKKIFGKSSTMKEEEKKVLESIKEDYGCTCYVKGGYADKLQEEIDKQIAEKKPVNQKIFADWESVFNDAESVLNKNIATLIETELMPIYDFIESDKLKKMVADEIVTESKLEENSFTTTNDYAYCASVTSATSASSDHIYTIYDDKKPLAEVCSEYIPTIRTDRKVTVVYPVSADGKPDLARGFFIGDGEGHRPGTITWNNNHCIYTANYTYTNKEIVYNIYIYKYDIYGRKEVYFPQIKNLGLTKAGNSLIGNPSSAFSYTKIGSDYWAYLSKDYLWKDAISLTPAKDSITYKLPDPKDLQKLKSFLENDLITLLATDGRSGLNIPSIDNSFWLNRSDTCYTIYPSGASTIKKDTGGKHKLLLLRKDNYHY